MIQQQKFAHTHITKNVYGILQTLFVYYFWNCVVFLNPTQGTASALICSIFGWCASQTLQSLKIENWQVY